MRTSGRSLRIRHSSQCLTTDSLERAVAIRTPAIELRPTTGSDGAHLHGVAAVPHGDEQEGRPLARLCLPMAVPLRPAQGLPGILARRPALHLGAEGSLGRAGARVLQSCGAEHSGVTAVALDRLAHLSARHLVSSGVRTVTE